MENLVDGYREAIQLKRDDLPHDETLKDDATSWQAEAYRGESVEVRRSFPPLMVSAHPQSKPLKTL